RLRAVQDVRGDGDGAARDLLRALRRAGDPRRLRIRGRIERSGGPPRHDRARAPASRGGRRARTSCPAARRRALRLVRDGPHPPAGGRRAVLAARWSRCVSDVFRLAICGAGRVAAAAHVPAALASRAIELVALVDPTPGRAETLAASFDIRPEIRRRLADVLGRIDGAVIATPNHTHGELALECLAVGVPVLIEKPLATSAADAARIVRAAEEHRVTAAVGYNTRFTEGVELMASLLRARAFGAVRRFAYQTGSTGKWSPLSGYMLDRDAIGGGVVM